MTILTCHAYLFEFDTKYIMPYDNTCVQIKYMYTRLVTMLPCVIYVLVIKKKYQMLYTVCQDNSYSNLTLTLTLLFFSGYVSLLI